MRKFVIAGVASLLSLVSIVGIAQAQGQPGPNGNNNHGMCTAYFNGQKKGWDKNGTPGPFANLESSAETSEASQESSAAENAPNEAASDVYEYCDNGANIGGNPDQNGRYASCFTTDSTGASEFSC